MSLIVTHIRWSQNIEARTCVLKPGYGLCSGHLKEFVRAVRFFATGKFVVGKGRQFDVHDLWRERVFNGFSQEGVLEAKTGAGCGKIDRCMGVGHLDSLIQDLL